MTGQRDGWLAALRARADQPPARLRVPLWAGDACIGSVEPDLFPRALPASRIGPQGWVSENGDGDAGWRVAGDLTATLSHVAFALRDAGLAHAWRDEQLAVRAGDGPLLGTVERGVVRQLGIATRAVHLVGYAPDGRMWVQQRAFSKPNDPGLWDTLVGGMVPATDTVPVALGRETWEEAGLRMSQLQDVTHGGRIAIRRSSGSHAGYVDEQIDWYRCIVPSTLAPANLDGEVEQFVLMPPDELRARLPQEHFTTEASLIIAATGVFEG